MSDNWVIFVPTDPQLVPKQAARKRAVELAEELWPDADEVEVVVSRKLMVFDCGVNLSSIRCPTCSAKLSVDWFNDEIPEYFATKRGRADVPLNLACGCRHSLQELKYKWPVGFGRFGLSLMNPRAGARGVSKAKRAKIEAALGCRVMVVYEHL